MSNTRFLDTAEQYQFFLNPLFKAHELAVANLEKLVSFQVDAWQSYVDMGLDRLKAAADISDSASLQAFFSGQAGAANVLSQKLLEDTKALADLNAGFAAEFGKLVRDNVTQLGDKTAMAADQAVKVTKEATDAVARGSKTARA